MKVEPVALSALRRRIVEKMLIAIFG